MIDISKFSLTVDQYEQLKNLYGDKLDKELNLELESKEMAYESFLNKCSKAQEVSSVHIGTTKTIVEEAVPALSKAIKAFYEASDSGKSGKRHRLATALKTLDISKVAFLTVKVVMTNAMSRIQVPSLVQLIGEALDDERVYSHLMDEMPNNKRKATLEGLNKRISTAYKERYLKAVAKRQYEAVQDSEPPKRLTKPEKGSIGLKLLELFTISTGLGYFECEKTNRGGKASIRNYYLLDPDVVNYVHENNKQLADLFFNHRPMVIPPKPWSSPVGGGYYINLRKPVPLVRMPLEKCLKLYQDVDMPEVYNAVNSIQSTAWRINKKVLEVANTLQEWQYLPEALGMPSALPADKPVRPSEADTNEEVQREWRKAMVRYYQADNQRKSKRFLVNSALLLANLYKDEEAIYFPHNVDFRGRVYPLTTLSPQGNDFVKALIEFSEGVELGESGATWLAFHTANCYGLDKAPIQDRISWAYENQDLLLSYASKPLENLGWTEADSPWEFLACCFEWEGYAKEGSNYKSHIAVAFDGSCSGIQHFSAMLKDPIGGTAVNLIPDSKVHDIYKIVADAVTEQVKKDLDSNDEDSIVETEEGAYLKKGKTSLAREWLKFGITRKVTKRCVMTLPYGAKRFGFTDQILEDTIYPALDHNPYAFSKPHQSATYMAGHIWNAVHTVVVKAMEAMEWLQDTSALLAKDRGLDGRPLPVFWITPAGFPVLQDYRKFKPVKIQTLLSGGVIIKELDKEEVKKDGYIHCQVNIETQDLDPRKQRQGIAPNFVHSMDASHLMLTVNSCVRQGVNAFAMIHDSYGCHAGHGNIMFKTVRDVFVDTYSNRDILKDLHDHVSNLLSSELVEELKDSPSQGDLDLNCVRESLYAFS